MWDSFCSTSWSHLHRVISSNTFGVHLIEWDGIKNRKKKLWISPLLNTVRQFNMRNTSVNNENKGWQFQGPGVERVPVTHWHLNKTEPFFNVMSPTSSVPAMTSQNVGCEKGLLIFPDGFVAPEEGRHTNRQDGKRKRPKPAVFCI